MERAAAAGYKGKAVASVGNPSPLVGLGPAQGQNRPTPAFPLKQNGKVIPQCSQPPSAPGGNLYSPLFRDQGELGRRNPGTASPGTNPFWSPFRGETSGESDYSSLLTNMGADFRLLGRGRRRGMQYLSSAGPCSSWKTRFPYSCPSFCRTAPLWASRRQPPGRPSWMNSREGRLCPS